MRFIASITSITAALFLATSTFAQQVGVGRTGLYTTTLPWVDGNTLVISVGTDAFGATVTSTISTLGGNTLNTPLPSSTSSSSRRPGQVVTPTSSSSVERVVGNTPATNGPPMRTTTYWFDPGNGVWTVATWTASVTAAPAVATVNVPEGTIQEYGPYQSVVNSAVLSSAQAAATLLSNSTGAGSLRIRSLGPEGGVQALVPWLGAVVAMFGAGWGILAL